LTLNNVDTDADRANMLVTTPRARVAVVLVLTAAMAALMLVRVGYGERQGATPSSVASVSLERHTPGSAAHDRHEARLRLEAAAALSER
jgi:hypothetical protein